MKKFNSSKWITENKYGKLPEMKYDDPFDKEEEDPKKPFGAPGLEEEYNANKIKDSLKNLAKEKDLPGFGPTTTVDDDVRSDLVGIILPSLEKANAPEELIKNLEILSNKYNTDQGVSLAQQPDEVKNAITYLTGDEAQKSVDQIGDIAGGHADALKPGTEKIYTADAFPDGLKDSDFYKKAVKDGWKFITKNSLTPDQEKIAKSLPTKSDGTPLKEKLKNKIRKVIKEQIKKLHEANQTLIVTSEDGVEVQITDLRDIQDFLSGDGIVYGEDQDGRSVEVSMNSALDHKMAESMNPEEWADAKEADRLAQHPEKDKINKIKQMMDKEKEEMHDDPGDIRIDHDYYANEEKSLKEKAAELGYLKEDYKPSHRAYNVIDKSNNDEIVAKELPRWKALELAHTNKNYMIDATDRLAETEGAKQARLLHNMYYSNFHGTTFAEDDLELHDIDPNSEEDGHEAFLYMAKGTLLTWDDEDETWVDDEGSDIAVDSDQIAYAVGEARADWTPPPMGMGGEEEEDEEQKEYDKGWYGESLNELSTQLGYLKEVDGMEGGFDHSKFDFQEKVTKASFIYNEQNQKFYSLTLYTSDNRQIKLKYSEANSWLKDTLEYIHEGDLIPKHYSDGLEDLDLFVERLEELGIEASHNEYDFS